MFRVFGTKLDDIDDTKNIGGPTPLEFEEDAAKRQQGQGLKIMTPK